MTANISLERQGFALFGPRWKAPLARRIGVTRETVSRWQSRTAEIPRWAELFIAELIRSRGTVLSLCDRTGNIVKPWAEAGFECLCVDVQHQGEGDRDGVRFVGADIRTWMPPPRRYAIVFSFPPCTNLAVSGARWFQEKKLDGLAQAVELVDACRRICEWSQAPWMIENPVGTLSSYWRRPDFIFDPCEFGGWLSPPGDHYTKKTCLWTGGGFRMPTKKPVPALQGSKMHRMPPSEQRHNERSVTPQGFSLAVFAANACLPSRNGSAQLLP